MKASKFLSLEQSNDILQALHKAEDKTSGEIRLHLENYCETGLIERAKEVFSILQMENTVHRNGILIYIAVIDKKVAILGDEGIDKVTPEDYWQEQVKILLDYFKKAEFSLGIIEVINQIANKLQTHFPIEENDFNELSDEISFFEN